MRADWQVEAPVLAPMIAEGLTNRATNSFSLPRAVSKLEKVNLAEKFSLFKDYWSPKVVGEVNENQVRVAKAKGDEFVWHHHDNADELFLVVKGRLTIKLRDRDVNLKEGELFVVPKGFEHKPVAHREVHVLMIDAKETVNTGDVRDERTVEKLERI